MQSFVFLGAVLFACDCSAASQYWDGSFTSGPNSPHGGSGNWNTSVPSNTNWTDSLGLTHSTWASDGAVFNVTPGTATLNVDNISFTQIEFAVSGYIIAGPKTLNMLPAFTYIQTDPGVSATISCNLIGPAATDFIKTGDGTLTLSGLGNSFQRTVVVQGGVLDVTGAIVTSGTTWVGNGTNNNALNLTGSILSTGDIDIGVVVGSMNNVATVTGGTWTATSGTLSVGSQGPNNAMNIQSGGLVSVHSCDIGPITGTSNSSVTVTDLNSHLSVATTLTVGDASSFNSLTIKNGGLVDGPTTTVGNQITSAFNTIVVDGIGSSTPSLNSTLNCITSLTIGQAESFNSLMITNGGQVNSKLTVIGNLSTTSSNFALVQNPHSLWTITGNLYVGESGSSNSLAVSKGGIVDVSTQDAVVGLNAGANLNVLQVSDPGSQLNVSGGVSLYIGKAGSSNSLLISNGAVVSVNKNCIIGHVVNANSNSATVSGANSNWNCTGTFRVGTDGSGNSLLIENGGSVLVGTKLTIGSNSDAINNSVTVDGPGSLLGGSTSTPPTVVVGDSGIGSSLTVTNSGSVTASVITLAKSTATSSGTLNIGTGGLPGTLNTPGVAGVAGTALVVFNHNSPSYTFLPILAGNLSVKHIGPGTTILASPNTYSGATTINAGVLAAGGADVLSPSSSITVNSNGALNLGGADQSIGALTNNGLVDFGGTTTGAFLNVNGNYTQTGSGTLLDKINLAGQSDLVNTNATAFLGGTLSVVALDGYSLFDTYNVIHSNNTISTTFDTVVSNNSLVLTSVIYDSNDVYLMFRQNLGFAALTHNETVVATQLDGINNPTSDELAVLEALVNLSVHDARNALDNIAGEQYTYIVELDRYSNETLNRRIFNALRKTLSPCWCENPCEPIQTWFQLGEGQGYAHRDCNSNGLRTLNWDFTLGGFTPICEGLLIGVAANYEIQNVQFYEGGHTHWHTGQAALQGIYQNACGYLLADLIIGQSWGKVRREIDFGSIHRVAKSKPKVTQGFVYAETGFNYFWCDVLLQPFVGFEAGFYRQKEFDESGADSLNLTVSKQEVNTYDSYLGTHVTTYWDCFVINADISWQHRYDRSCVNTTTRFEEFGESFSIYGVRLGRNAVNWAFNASTEYREGVTLYAELSGQRWKNWSTYGIDLGISLEW